MAETDFTRSQIEEAYPPGIERHFWTHARNVLVLESLRALTGGQPFRRVLEVGCGRGVVVGYLRSRGIECRGVELSPGSVDLDLAGVVETGRDCFALSEAERQAVDCLMLLDVIEHLPDPVGFLTAVRAAFPRARALLVSVPARRELWSNYDTHFGHFRRYDIASLRDDVTAAGFRVLRCRYLFHALYPVMFLLARIAGKRNVVQRTPRHLWLHSLLSWVLLTDTALLPDGLVGTSVLCLAEAPVGQDTEGKAALPSRE